MLKELLLSGALLVGVATTAGALRGVALFAARDVAESNFEVGVFALPIANDVLRLGMCTSVRNESDVPMDASVMFGMGLCGERILSEAAAFGARIQGYFGVGRGVDTTGDGFVDQTSGYGSCALIQAYLAWQVSSKVGILCGLTGRRTNFHAEVDGIDTTGLPSIDVSLEIGLRLGNLLAPERDPVGAGASDTTSTGFPAR